MAPTHDEQAIEHIDEGMTRATIWLTQTPQGAAYTVSVGRRVWDAFLAEWYVTSRLGVDDLVSAAVALANAQRRVLDLMAESEREAAERRPDAGRTYAPRGTPKAPGPKRTRKAVMTKPARSR